MQQESTSVALARMARDLFEVVGTTYQDIVAPYPTRTLVEDAEKLGEAGGRIAAERGYHDVASAERYLAALLSIAAAMAAAHYKITTEPFDVGVLTTEETK